MINNFIAYLRFLNQQRIIRKNGLPAQMMATLREGKVMMDHYFKMRRNAELNADYDTWAAWNEMYRDVRQRRRETIKKLRANASAGTITVRWN